MRNLKTSKYKVTYFVNQNGRRWEVVEFPTNDVVRSFRRKVDAEMLSEHLVTNKPFGDTPLPKFLKGSLDNVDNVEY